MDEFKERCGFSCFQNIAAVFQEKDAVVSTCIVSHNREITLKGIRVLNDHLWELP